MTLKVWIAKTIFTPYIGRGIGSSSTSVHRLAAYTKKEAIREALKTALLLGGVHGTAELVYIYELKED